MSTMTTTYFVNNYFVEKYAWVDYMLEEKCRREMHRLENGRVLCPAPLSWANYRSGAVFECIEDDNCDAERRARAESDISDYVREAFIASNTLNNGNRNAK